MLRATIELQNKSNLCMPNFFFDKDFYTEQITQENSVAMIFQCFRY